MAKPKPVSVRPVTEAELERWRRCAAYDGPKLSFSAWLRRSLNEACDVIEANCRNARRETEQIRRLHAMDPTEARRLDWGRSASSEGP